MKTLVISAAAIVGFLAMIVSLVAIVGDPQGGEPYLIVEIDSQGRPHAEVESAVSKDLARPRYPDSIAQNSVRLDGASRQQNATLASSNALDAPSENHATLNRQAGAMGAVRVVPAGATTMATVPVAALVEKSRFGPLPKIAADGRQPSKIYAKPTPHNALPQAGEPARIAILINGLGLSELATSQAINMLPGNVTLAFSPYGRNLQNWVRLSREAEHEVMLQIPLEPFDYPDNDPGPHTLLSNLSPEENLKRLQWLMARFTGYVGITNHMGAKFVSTQSAFLPILEELKSRGLIFLDDGTSARSTASAIARDLGLGFSAAQFVIDATQTPEGIDEALARLETVAHENGLSIGVATSLPFTIERIAQWSRTLSKKGMVLVPISAAIRAQPQN